MTRFPSTNKEVKRMEPSKKRPRSSDSSSGGEYFKQPSPQRQQQQQQQQQAINYSTSNISANRAHISSSQSQSIGNPVQYINQRQLPASFGSLVDPNSQDAILLSGRPPVMLYLSWDHYSLTPYQILLRQNIELFEATASDLDSHASTHGAHNPRRTIIMGQVGLRCRHCAHLPPSQRAPRACYYPTSLMTVYQAAQNLGNGHLLELCQNIPPPLRQQLTDLRTEKQSGGGKQIWADRLTALGVYEDGHGLRFAPSLNEFADQIPILE